MSPEEYNPERGFSGTANAMSLPEDYPIDRYKAGSSGLPLALQTLVEFLDTPEPIAWKIPWLSSATTTRCWRAA